MMVFHLKALCHITILILGTGYNAHHTIFVHDISVTDIVTVTLIGF